MSTNDKSKAVRVSVLDASPFASRYACPNALSSVALSVSKSTVTATIPNIDSVIPLVRYVKPSLTEDISSPSFPRG